MSYRKFKAARLFTGHEMNTKEKVLITNEEGVIEALLPAEEAGEGVEFLDGILSPGFINCHCHLELSHMKGLIPEGTGLPGFLLEVMQKREFPTGKILEALDEAEMAMLHEGIVAVGDICNTSHSLEKKKEGNLYYHNFIETMGFVPGGAAARFEISRGVFEAFAEAYSLPIESNSIVPHAPYSVSAALFGMIANFPGNHVLSIHNQETAAENEFMEAGSGAFLPLYEALGVDISPFRGQGRRSLAGYLPYFYPNQSLILVHNVDTKEEDLAFVRGRPSPAPRLYFCLCPNANLYISGSLPDVPLLLRHSCTIVVGTDSLASNHGLSILEELKTLETHFPGKPGAPELPMETLLGWATINGARALQLDSALGSFEAGKQPGILLIEDTEGDRLGKAARVRRIL